MMNLRLILVLGLASGGLLILPAGSAQERPAAPKVMVQSDGTVEVPAQTVPMSPFLSPEAKAYVTQHLRDMQDPEILKQDAGVPRFMKGYLVRDYQLFAVEKKDQKVGGVHAFVYAPKSGVSAKNKDRVLINLHGGGFSGCWPGCAELEPIGDDAELGVHPIDPAAEFQQSGHVSPWYSRSAPAMRTPPAKFHLAGAEYAFPAAQSYC